MANMEKEVVRLMAQEIISAIKKVNETNNKNYVDAQLKNVKVSGTIGGSSSSGGGAITGDTINASQVVDLYSTIAGFISRAPENSELGDVDAGKIVTTIAGLAALEIQSATIDTAQIENLYASYGEFINMVAKNAEIENLDVEQVRADIAEMGLANIKDAKIGWAQIEGLVANTALIREGVGGKLYIDDLAVNEAQILTLFTGELVLQGIDGKLYTVYLDDEKKLQTKERSITGSDIANESIEGSNIASGSIKGANIAENTITGALITEHGITARELNVSQIFADEALIRAIKAANLDVDDLFANEAFINVLTTSIIRSPTIGKDIDISNNSSIVLTDKKIGLVVSSESTETELVLTDQMMEVIADQVQISADTIDFSANESITAVVQKEVAGIADTIVVGEEPQQPVVNMVWLDTTVEPNTFKRWNGELWEIINDVASLADKINSAEIKIDANTTSIESAARSVDDLNTRVQSAEEKITPGAIIKTVRDRQEYKDDIASATMTSEKFETFVQNSQSISDMEMTAEKFETYVENSQGIADMKMTTEKFETYVENSEGISNLEMTAEKFETYIENSEGISNLKMTPEKFETFVENSEGISKISQKADEIDFILENGSMSTEVKLTSAAIDAISQNIILNANEEFSLVVGDLEASIGANTNGIALITGKADNLERLSSIEVVEGTFAQADRREGEGIHVFGEFGPKQAGTPYPPGGGKNKLDIERVADISNWINGSTWESYEIEVPPGTYYFSCKPIVSKVDNFILSIGKSMGGDTIITVVNINVSKTEGLIDLKDGEKLYLNAFFGYGFTQENLDAVVEGVLVEAQLELGTVATPYEPFVGIFPVIGRNTLSFEHLGNNLFNMDSQSSGGITVSKNEDGAYVLNGTATSLRMIRTPCSLPNGTYILSSSSLPIGVYVRIRNAAGSLLATNNQESTLVHKFNGTPGICEFTIQSGVSLDNVVIQPQLEYVSASTNAATPYEPYHRKPYTVEFSETVYGGKVDCYTGEVAAEWGLIESYAGEELPGEWLSDRDVYAEGTTPTMGAQVVYKLASPVEINATPTQPATLNGINTVYIDADSGYVEFGHELPEVIDSVMPPASPAIGTIWIDRSTPPAVFRRFNGSEWEILNDTTDIINVQNALQQQQKELRDKQAETDLFLKLDSANKVVRIGQKGVTSQYIIDAFGSGVSVNDEIFSRFEANRVLFGDMEMRKPSGVGGLAFDSLPKGGA